VMENQFSQRLILGLLDYQLRVPAEKEWEDDEKIDIDGNGERMEDIPRSAASCRTFGVGEAC
jgi:hypothetical protein